MSRMWTIIWTKTVKKEARPSWMLLWKVWRLKHINNGILVWRSETKAFFLDNCPVLGERWDSILNLLKKKWQFWFCRTKCSLASTFHTWEMGSQNCCSTHEVCWIGGCGLPSLLYCWHHSRWFLLFSNLFMLNMYVWPFFFFFVGWVLKKKKFWEISNATLMLSFWLWCS